MTDKEFKEQLGKEGKIIKAAADPTDYIKKPVFEVLNSVNVNGHTEGRNDLTYLSWVWAIAEVMKLYPDMQYEVVKHENGLPYVYDEKTGYMVYTKVTIEGVTHEMWLPVMDSSNKAMKNVPYKYKAKNKKTGEEYEKTVEAATMFDINKTIMRCLTKNLAMFGLGLYIYAGEDLPEEEKNAKDKADKAQAALNDLKNLYEMNGGTDWENHLKEIAPDGMTNDIYKVEMARLKKEITDKAEKKEKKA